MLTTRQTRRTKAPQRSPLKESSFKFQVPDSNQGHWHDGSLRSSYHTAHRAVKKDNLQRENRFNIKLPIPLMGSYPALRDTHTPNRMLTTRQKRATKSPTQKGRFQRRTRSNFKFPTLIRGTGPTGSLRSSYPTARRAVQKDNLQRKNRFNIKFSAPLRVSYPALRDTDLSK